MYIDLPTLKNVHLKPDLRALVRADFDVAVEHGRILDDFRIREVIPTLKYMLDRGAHVRLLCHRGRPNGRRTSSLSQEVIVPVLSRLLKRNVVYVKNPVDADTLRRFVHTPGILLFENLRFWPGEEANDPAFAHALVRWGDVYINDAFANCHRRHASMVAVAARLPSFAGLRLEKELSVLDTLLRHPARPFVVAIAGAKIETKLPLIKHFLKEADSVMVGGAIANTILALRGLTIGKSLVDLVTDSSRRPRWVRHPKLYVPEDVIASRSLKGNAKGSVTSMGEIGPRDYILDVGPKTIEQFAHIIVKARTVMWNGTLGLAEHAAFAQGTIEFAKAVGHAKGLRVVGGGDTVTAIHTYGLEKNFDHISTGGGAMLEFLAGKKLPGIEALKNSKIKMQKSK